MPPHKKTFKWTAPREPNEFSNGFPAQFLSHTHTHTRTRAHARTHARAHARARTHARTHACTHARTTHARETMRSILACNSLDVLQSYPLQAFMSACIWPSSLAATASTSRFEWRRHAAWDGAFAGEEDLNTRAYQWLMEESLCHPNPTTATLWRRLYHIDRLALALKRGH